MQPPPIETFWSRTDRDAVAIIAPDHTTWTVGAVQDSANQVAHQLRAAGCDRADAVAICMRNAPEALVLYLAVTQIGMYVVPLSWHLTAPEAHYIIEDSGAKLVVAGAEQAARVSGVGVPVYVVGEPVEGCRRWSELTSGDVQRPRGRWAGGPMTYTSGTTGQPKGVRRPLPPAPPELVASGYAMFLMMYGMVPGQGVHIVCSPLYHTAVLYFASSSLHLGHTVVLMDRWTPEGMLERIERYQVTSSHMVPTLFSRLLNLEGRQRYDMSSLRHMVHSAAPCPVPVKWAMLEWWGDCVYEYYAASEGGGTMITPSEWRQRPGSVGRAWATAEIAIFDDDGHRLGPGKIGTVYIKMQQGFSYHRDKEKTDKAWRTDGYFTVGDAGYLDEEGYLFLCDRKADMIISGGVNIYPAEVESALSGHPRVLDVAVFGIPDADWGEQVKAVVELRDSSPAEDGLGDEIIAWARERLAGFKCPRTIDFVETLPREPNGKLKKRLLRAPYWAGTGRSI
ncbi:MAG: long-chain acyl-CoA synthetase [Myxococcota bacterium]|jgi:long-chain acyl-CoA synthetase